MTPIGPSRSEILSVKGPNGGIVYGPTEKGLDVILKQAKTFKSEGRFNRKAENRKAQFENFQQQVEAEEDEEFKENIKAQEHEDITADLHYREGEKML